MKLFSSFEYGSATIKIYYANKRTWVVKSSDLLNRPAPSMQRLYYNQEKTLGTFDSPHHVAMFLVTKGFITVESTLYALLLANNPVKVKRFFDLMTEGKIEVNRVLLSDGVLYEAVSGDYKGYGVVDKFDKGVSFVKVDDVKRNLA